MKNDEPFGVVLLADGFEAGGQQPISTLAMGTLASVSDWFQGSDGVLGITALGAERFRLKDVIRQRDGLNLGTIELIEPEASVRLPREYSLMADLLRAVIDDFGRLYESIERRYDDASWVGFRFAEILPLGLEQKQHCLEMNDAVARLAYLQPLLREVREEQPQ
jgi:Lon protease-like protein